jgi:glycosyltransferase involved in cell wall biosynthesis
MGSAGKRRVLVIVQNLPVPFDRRVWLEATTLQRAGYEVSVICPKAKGFNQSYERLEGVHIHRYTLPIDAQGPLGYVLEFVWCFVRTLLKSVRVAVAGPGFDVIHACNPPETYWLLALLWRPFGKRFLFDHHDLSPEMYAAKFGRSHGLVFDGLLFLESMTFKAADVVVTTNESHKQVAVERGGMRPEEVFIVRSGPDLTRFTICPADPSWRQHKEHLLVYLGEMCVQDGVDYLIRAVKALRDDFGRDDFHCVLVGGGPHQQAMREYAEAQGVAAQCTFTGRVSDEVLCEVLSSADVAVDPDPWTPWSDKSTMNKIMEYMFFGLPIVAFDLRENRFSAQDAAVYARAGDEPEFARLIAEMLDDPERRGARGARGTRRVREALAWEYSVPNLLAAYDRAFVAGGTA